MQYLKVKYNSTLFIIISVCTATSQAVTPALGLTHTFTPGTYTETHVF